MSLFTYADVSEGPLPPGSFFHFYQKLPSGSRVNSKVLSEETHLISKRGHFIRSARVKPNKTELLLSIWVINICQDRRNIFILGGLTKDLDL